MVMFVHVVVWALLSLHMVKSMEQGSEQVVVVGKMEIPLFVMVLGNDYMGVSKVVEGTMVGVVLCVGGWLGMMVDELPTDTGCRGRPHPHPLRNNLSYVRRILNHDYHVLILYIHR